MSTMTTDNTQAKVLLVAALERAERAENELAKATAERDDLIRQLLPTEGATRLAKATGLARSRIYQIAEARSD